MLLKGDPGRGSWGVDKEQPLWVGALGEGQGAREEDWAWEAVL